MRYTVILIGEASGFSALVPAMPGCQSQGDTPEEALGNVRALRDEKGFLRSAHGRVLRGGVADRAAARSGSRQILSDETPFGARWISCP